MSPSSYSFSVGEFDCLAVHDGTVLFNVSSFFCNAPDDELERALAGFEVVEDGKFCTPLNPLVVQADVLTVLIDTGMGVSGPRTAGKLLSSLAAEDMTPEDIDLVILSHAHPDHMGGAVDADGNLVFDQARYILSEIEYNFWFSDAARALNARMTIQLREILGQITSRLELVPTETTILPGVRTIPAPGHTPGQVAVLLESEGEQLIYTADTFAHPLHFQYPEWNIISDIDRVLAVQTRGVLLERRVPFYVYHHSLPGQ